MTIKMAHAVKPANSEAKAAAFISGAGASAQPIAERLEGQSSRQYAIRRGASAANRSRRKRSGHNPHRLAARGCSQGARVGQGLKYLAGPDRERTAAEQPANTA